MGPLGVITAVDTVEQGAINRTAVAGGVFSIKSSDQFTGLTISISGGAVGDSKLRPKSTNLSEKKRFSPAYSVYMPYHVLVIAFGYTLSNN